MNNLDVIFSSDEQYSRHLGVSITSLLENNNKFETINIYVIDRDINNENKKRIINIVNKYKTNIQFINFKYIENKIRSNIDNSKSISIYARLYIQSILPKEVKKIIYFDCDSIINYDLTELWNININGYYVAGVEDTIPNKYKQVIGLCKNDIYINSGMLLINLEKWRKDNLEEKFTQFINIYNGFVPHHDQGVINGICKGKILKIHPKYNCNSNFYSFSSKEIEKIFNINKYYNQIELDEAINKPVFLHYTPGFLGRPWTKECIHPKKDLYLKYKKLTPWKDELLQKDYSNWKVKSLSKAYKLIPRKIFIKIYKSIM